MTRQQKIEFIKRQLASSTLIYGPRELSVLDIDDEIPDPVVDWCYQLAVEQAGQKRRAGR